MPRMANLYKRKQGSRSVNNALAVLLSCAGDIRRGFAIAVLFVGLLGNTTVHAIPPNTPITNTAQVDYTVAGTDYLVNDIVVVKVI